MAIKQGHVRGLSPLTGASQHVKKRRGKYNFRTQAMTKPDMERGPVCNMGSKKSIRLYVEAGLCPICGFGPYKVVAQHTRHRHGISAEELRELMGVYRNTSICAPEHSELRRKQMIERGIPDGFRPKPGRKRELSTAAKLMRREQLEGFRAAETERCKAAKAINIPIMLNMIDEGLSLKEIGRQLGLHKQTVVVQLKEAGVGDLRGKTPQSIAVKTRMLELHRERGATTRKLVAELVKQGQSTKEIATKLEISESYVRKIKRT